MDEFDITALLFGTLLVVVLVAANAFFVAAEFALVGARMTRLAALAERGDTKAKLAHKALQSLDRYISATQLGITLASLGLGWIGERVVATTLEGAFGALPAPWNVVGTHAVALPVAFTFITILHIVLGELAPKAFALLHPEDTSRWVAAPLMAFTAATNPFIWVLNGAANLVLKMCGMKPPSAHERVHRPEEIVMLVHQTHRSGHLAAQDVELIEGVFEFTEKNVRDVMTPRTEVVGLDAEISVEEAAAAVRESGRSRYPVYQGSLDDIVGIVHAKDLLTSMSDAKFQKIRTIMRGEPLFVPGSREVEDLLTDMKRLKQHIAVVLDEYGGTAGIVTMEDILEEIVGLIFDEYDDPHEGDAPAGDSLTVPGSMEIEEANAHFGITIATDQHQTVGGYVFGQIGRLPRVGDVIAVDNTSLRVLEMDGRRIATLQVVPLPAVETADTKDDG